jgi:hypothetical protein
MLRGDQPKLVESQVRYLWVDDNRCESDAGWEQTLGGYLTERAHALGFQVLPARGVGPIPDDFMTSVAAQATFTKFYRLTITKGVTSLVSLPDGEQLMTISGDIDLCKGRDDPRSFPASLEIVRRILSCLPGRISLTGSGAGADNLGCMEPSMRNADSAVSDGCRGLDGTQRCLSVKVDGQFPTSDVRLVPLVDLMGQGVAATGTLIDWNKAVTRSCVSGVGQCFTIPYRADQPLLPGDWVLIEEAIRTLAKAADEACET